MVAQVRRVFRGFTYYRVLTQILKRVCFKGEGIFTVPATQSRSVMVRWLLQHYSTSNHPLFPTIVKTDGKSTSYGTLQGT